MFESHPQSINEGDAMCVQTVAKQLKIHGLPHDADQLERELDQVSAEPKAVAELRKRTMDKFLHYFEI